jgi:hypothetical protein
MTKQKKRRIKLPMDLPLSSIDETDESVPSNSVAEETTIEAARVRFVEALESIATIETIAHEHPGFLTTQDRNGNNLLHMACRRISTRGFMDAILGLFPDAAETLGNTSHNGSTPLHLACRRDKPFEVIEMLLERCPEALQIADNAGWTPLHVACRHTSSMKVIQLLFKAYPDAAQMRTVDGGTPLHVLFRYRGTDATVEVVQLLLSSVGSNVVADKG